MTDLVDVSLVRKPPFDFFAAAAAAAASAATSAAASASAIWNLSLLISSSALSARLRTAAASHAVNTRRATVLARWAQSATTAASAMAERSNASEIISSLGAPVLFRDELGRDPTESTEIRDEDRGVSGISGRAPAADHSPAEGSRSTLTWSTLAEAPGDEETSASSAATATGSPPPTDEPRGSDGALGADPC